MHCRRLIGQQYLCVTGQHDNTTKLDTCQSVQELLGDATLIKRIHVDTLAPPSTKNIPLSDFGWMAM